MNSSYQHYATHDESEYPELWDGCVGAWAPCLGPSGARLHDTTSRANWGELTNMDAATDWVVSSGQYALDFDSTNDFVSLAHEFVLFNGHPFTISWWERISANSDFQGRFFLKISGTSRYFAVYRSQSSQYLTISFGRDQQNSLKSTTAPSIDSSIGRWRNWVITGTDPVSLDPTKARLYCDGIEYPVVAGNIYGTVTGDSRIGQDGLSNGVNALLDSITIHRREIGANDARMLFAIGRGGMYTPRRRRKAYFLGPTFNAAWARGSNVILQPAMGVG